MLVPSLAPRTKWLSSEIEHSLSRRKKVKSSSVSFLEIENTTITTLCNHGWGKFRLNKWMEDFIGGLILQLLNDRIIHKFRHMTDVGFGSFDWSTCTNNVSNWLTSNTGYEIQLFLRILKLSFVNPLASASRINANRILKLVLPYLNNLSLWMDGRKTK